MSFSLAACGGDEHHEVPEGEAIEVDGVRYNVMITRYLNPDMVDDRAYLGPEYAEWPAADKYLLGVFLQIHNESGDTITIPEDLTVVDTQDRRYEPIVVDSDYALELGAELADGKNVPAIDSPPFYGPIQGSLLLYEIETTSAENRPLKFEIPKADGSHGGAIVLDI